MGEAGGCMLCLLVIPRVGLCACLCECLSMGVCVAI